VVQFIAVPIWADGSHFSARRRGRSRSGRHSRGWRTQGPIHGRRQIGDVGAEGHLDGVEIGAHSRSYALDGEVDGLELRRGLIDEDLDSVEGLFLVLEETGLILFPRVGLQQIVEGGASGDKLSIASARRRTAKRVAW
jgi:hypothetical protein